MVPDDSRAGRLLALVGELLRTARMIPNREDGGIIVLLDLETYIALEDRYELFQQHKERLHGNPAIQHDVILGTTVQ